MLMNQAQEHNSIRLLGIHHSLIALFTPFHFAFESENVNGTGAGTSCSTTTSPPTNIIKVIPLTGNPFHDWKVSADQLYSRADSQYDYLDKSTHDLSLCCIKVYPSNPEGLAETLFSPSRGKKRNEPTTSYLSSYLKVQDSSLNGILYSSMDDECHTSLKELLVDLAKVMKERINSGLSDKWIIPDAVEDKDKSDVKPVLKWFNDLLVKNEHCESFFKSMAKAIFVV